MSKGTQTRATILQEAFGITYANGFQATSIDEILKKTNVTKGSFFHHFKSKEEMGLAMVYEVMYPGMRSVMIEPLINSDDPINELYNMMHGLLITSPFFDSKYGCPAINLIDEMSPISEAFNTALSKLTEEWKNAIIKSLENAQRTELIDAKQEVTQIALFIISGYGGIRNLGKLYGKSCYMPYLKEFRKYLDSL